MMNKSIISCNGVKISIENMDGLRALFNEIESNSKWNEDLKRFAEGFNNNKTFDFYKNSCNLISPLNNRTFAQYEWDILRDKWETITNKLTIPDTQSNSGIDKAKRNYEEVCNLLFESCREKKAQLQKDLPEDEKKKYTQPFAEINRLFSAWNLNKFSPIINDGVFQVIFKELKRRRLISYDTSANETLEKWTRNEWIVRSLLMRKLIEQFKQNVQFDTFSWNLYCTLTDGHIYELLNKNHNVILTGAPGTGKTCYAQKIANLFAGEGHVKFVQFHPSYDYTDFVEGLRPCPDHSFSRVDGVFKKFCKCAILGLNTSASDKDIEGRSEPESSCDDPYVFIIDEINRGEISKVFGELFFCIDHGHRGKTERVDTQYQTLLPDHDLFKNGFYVPNNVYILGTMNDIDRSVESMDFAFRRRFAFYEVKATSDMLDGLKVSSDELIKLKQKMDKLNEELVKAEYGLSSAYQLGGSYFLKYAEYSGQKNGYDNLWDYHLKGLLFEYFRGLPQDDINKKMDSLKKVYDTAGVKKTNPVVLKSNNPNQSSSAEGDTAS